MMAPVDDDGEPHAADEAAESERLTKQETHDAATDNQRDEAPARPRQLSDAARRDDREAQRAARHEQNARRALLQNRFLQRKEPRREQEQKPPPQHDAPDDDDVSPRIVEEKALVVTRRRSSAASSAMDKTKRERGGTIVVRPTTHVIPSLALRRSAWTRELDEDAACGLFVDHARRELAQIASSTLVRLDDRLRRETLPPAATRLTGLVHAPHDDDDHRVLVSTHSLQKPTRPRREMSTESKPPWAVATLEIALDRLVLDDHASFSLADRVETQLRSLAVSYTHLLRAQPWAALLRRVDAFVEARLLGAERATRAWRRQTVDDAQALLQSLGSLQQLHYELLAKWRELQDCYRQPTLPARAVKLRLDQQPLALSLDLASVRAFLELERAPDDDDETATTDKLTTRLDELETKDQYLHTVLTLEAVAVASSASRASSSHGGLLALGSCLPRLAPPTFYVALFVNDKAVARSRAASWSASSVGVVHLDETLRTQLQFFPDAVSLRVFERGLLVDSLVSTTAIPLLVPDHDLATSGSLADPRHRVAAASLAPSAEWYQFSSVRRIARARWHASFRNSSLFANAQRHPHGRVRVRVAWVAPSSLSHADHDHDHALETSQVVLPPRRPPVAARGNARLIGPRIDRRRLYESDVGRRADARGFSYERDFLVHVAHDVVDRNDPQNASVVRLQSHVQAQSALLQRRDVFRAAALVYDADWLRPSPWAVGAALTRRNRLLQLRDREHVAKHGTSMAVAATLREPSASVWDHDVFDEPLPLAEPAITSNAQFLSLLRPELPAFDLRQRLDDALVAGGDARLSLERERKLQQLRLQAFVDRVRGSHVARAHRQAQADAGKQRARTKTLATILQEQPMPLLPGAFDLSGLASLFSRRRRLRPRVEKRSAPSTMADWPRRCTVYVQVKSATNLPVRVTAATRGPAAQPKAKPKPKRAAGALSDDEDEDDTPEETVAPEPADSSHVFVEISFQGRRRRTTSTHARATGAVWMETAAFPFHAPHDDWSPDSLQKSPDVIRLSLFDQLVRASPSSDASDDAFLTATRTASDAHGADAAAQQQQRRVQSFHQENRYLGGLEIPFTTLYHNHGTLDATLRCEMPVVNVGYVNAKHATSADFVDGTSTAAGVERDDDGVLQSSREATFLSVMMTLDPLLPMPVRAFEENALSAGDDYAMLAAYASQWTNATQTLHAATRQRDFHVFARSLAHGQTFLTRYVSPQTPPPLTNDNAKRLSVSQLVRFVQLMPFLDDWQLFDGGGELDVWTTSQELLELNAGDFEEHAVLLCNLLNWLDCDDVNLRSFLVLATAVPEGKTVYVLRQDSYKIPQRSVLWNASTGVGYSATDDRCPVLDVSLVVSSDNIYANIQPRKRLSEMSWDVEFNAKAWRPFFHGPHKKEQFALPSLQTPVLTYAETPPELVKQVEVELRDALKLEIRRWRSVKYTTTFNMDVSLKLRSELERLELAMLHGTMRGTGLTKKKARADERDLIQELQRTRRVSGLPLNATFTDLTKIVAMVQNTNIYWNDHAQVEFGLAVYVHGYPNCVLSVWVYLVALEPLE